MSRKIWAIIGREYQTRVKTKGFVIGTLLFPLVIMFVMGGVYLFMSLSKPDSQQYVVVDQTNSVYSLFNTNFESDTLKTGEQRYIFTEQKCTLATVDSTVKNLQKQVLAQKIDGYFVIPDSVFEKPVVKYSARNVGNMDDQRKFRYALSRIVTNYRLEKLGVSPQTIRDEMNKGRVKLVSQQVVESGEVKKSGQSGFVLTYILTYIILLMLMIYGQTLMRSVIEEKSQRITETILSSVKPFEMMLGKIIGIFLVGFTQLVINGLMILGIISFAPMVLIGSGQAMPELIDFMNQLHFSPQMFVFMLVFFTLGFIYFSSMFAAIGAMVNTEDEATQFQMPLIFLIMMGYFIMFSALQHPDTSMAYWSSLIPLFSPFVMFARISISDPFLPNGLWLSIGILILAIFLQVYISAKIYRVGILMYGKKPSFREAIRWLKY